MRKLKPLISVAFIIALLIGVYYLADSSAWFKQSGAGSQTGQNNGVPNGGDSVNSPAASPSPAPSATDAAPDPTDDEQEAPSEQPTSTPEPSPTANNGSQNSSNSGIKPEDIPVVAEPASLTVLVNPANKLPEDYSPNDLVYPDVRFTFSEKLEKRMLRKEAAEALEVMFEAAEQDKIYLAGVSGYRSHGTQIKLFERYVKRDGYEKARTYSALPGTSEHETGLAIDVSGSDGKCAAADCFGDTEEAKWLAENAAEYGFVIRYPKGKQDITGYQYEPWHLRYVGKELAGKLYSDGLTLEEYFDATAVSKNHNGG
ncbi:peptidase M15 [Paenibacillus oryzae]|uniref:Peptidase M15 n=1 Tax=Paenibacillus oryzae TaxID=1844972 RepID=A0A1A5YQA8_9BACL|nr:M15 family metallopeptidase [Paenibacillus oryzae]OBR67801.1 peptidase M15 [Paenibacillus oryzae]